MKSGIIDECLEESKVLEPMNKPKSKSSTRAGNFLSGLSAGAVIGIINITIQISLAALIFSGPRVSFLPSGIGMMLVSAIIFLLIVGLTSSLRGTIAGPQDGPAALLGLAAAAISRGMPAGSSPEAVFATISATIAIAAILAGLFFLALGQFKSGNLVRFIPFPVVGGFLAGTGWLLVRGAFGVMVTLPGSLTGLSSLFSLKMLVVWLPGLALGSALTWVARHFKSPLMLPAAMLAATLGFYAWLLLSHTSLAAAGAAGLLFGNFPQGALWRPLVPGLLTQVNWQLVQGQAGQLAIVLVISVIALLLNAGGIEMATGQDMDLMGVERSAGLANLVSGISGGPVGYHYLANSVLAHKMGARNLTTIGVVGLMYLAVLFIGASILAYIPILLVGGLLLFLGFSFLIEWVYDAFFKLPRLDYMLVLAILVIIGVFGFLPGVGAGLGVALLVFVIRYSRINVVKHTLSGESFHSAVDRPVAQRQLLRKKGYKVFILELQGFIFFGTAQALLDRIRARLADTGQPKLNYLILDFRRVSGFDTSAVSTFMRIRQLAESDHLHLIFTQLSDEMTRQLEQGGLSRPANGSFSIFENLDYGVEWCENRILNERANVRGDLDNLIEQFGRVFQDGALLEHFLGYLEKMELPAGHVLARQGDLSDALFFIESGSLTAQLERSDGRAVRLRKLLSGTVAGEMGIYQENVRTASLVTAEPTTLYRLSRSAILRMQEADPGIAAALHQWIAQMMADRLAENNNTLVAIMD